MKHYMITGEWATNHFATGFLLHSLFITSCALSLSWLSLSVSLTLALIVKQSNSIKIDNCIDHFKNLLQFIVHFYAEPFHKTIQHTNSTKVSINII